MMSKMISRRVFLKATGLAVLSAAAAGALAGCGGGGANPTPGSPLAPEIDSSEFADFGRCTVDLGPMSGSWTSDAKYEADHVGHTYIYTGLQIDNGLETSPFTLQLSDFSCSIPAVPEARVCSLGNFTLNNDKTGFAFRESLTVAAGSRPNTSILYIDIGNTPATTLYGQNFTVTITKDGTSHTFHYNGLLNDPTFNA